MLTTTLLCLSLAAAPPLDRENLALHVVLNPAEHAAEVTAIWALRRDGDLSFRLSEHATIDRIQVNGRAHSAERMAVPGVAGGEGILYRIRRAAGEHVVSVQYRATFEQDIEAGERPGEIHNKSVNAFVGPQGVFLSEGAAWHPRLLEANGDPALLPTTISVQPIEGWVFVASGNPDSSHASPDEPPWSWTTPRPVDGVALAGNRHEIIGRGHETAHGPVELVMYVSKAQADKAPMFLDAAAEYLDLYVPRLGAFPYRRFTIVENFFSSGFAYPGFTLLGPRVVGMAPRSLAPGYLDHELVHNWWGNGVYVDPDDGNWCEALTSFCANYGRRVLEDDEEAGLAHRRGILMKLSSDPAAQDDGPLGDFGRAGGPGRFVGYDKGSFVFAMLADVIEGAAGESGESAWTCLRRFAEANLGRHAGWREIQAAFEAAAPQRPAGWLDGFFDLWVRRHTVPRTAATESGNVINAFAAQFADAPQQELTMVFGTGAATVEIDPQFRLYRVLPPEQIIPTLAGTQGRGGTRIEIDSSRPASTAYLARHESDANGENLLLIGIAAAGAHRALLARASDPIEIAANGRAFTLGGISWNGPDHAVLHTMQHPDRPGRFITVFHANGEAGWARLRLIDFYTRDSSIVWDGADVVDRRTFEPDRRIPLSAATPRAD